METIGDAYLIVAGIPVYISDHADRVTSMAFSMQSVADTVTTPMDGEPIQVRVPFNIIVSMQSVADTVTSPIDGEPIQLRVPFNIIVSMQSVADTVTSPMDGELIQVRVPFIISHHEGTSGISD